MRTPENHVAHAIQEERREAQLLEALGISVERIEHLKSIARLVAGDWGMTVEIGKPGMGSFFHHRENRIQFDPLHLVDAEGIDMAEFVAAHEGGHRAITRVPEALGVASEKAKELYTKIGFAFGSNALEDPADNDWWSRKYGGLANTVKHVYDDQLSKEDAVLGTPEINKITAELGYVPKFARFGSEFIRLWHQGRFSTNLPEDVHDALIRVKVAAREYFNAIPEEHPTEDRVIDRARERFRIFHDRIWPEMERLVREDMTDERLRQMLEEKKNLENLPKDLRDELEKAMRESAERAAGTAEQEADGAAAEKESDARALREAADKLRKDGKNKQAEELEGLAKKFEAEANDLREQGAEQAKKYRTGKSSHPVPMEGLSEELRRALEDAFSKLKPDDRRRLEEAARRELERFEDVLNKELQGKLEPHPTESHEEHRRREEAEKLTHEKAEREAKELRETGEKISKALEGERTEYDKAYEDVQLLIHTLADDLDRIFLPHRHPRWRPGHPTGQRISLVKAMQFEANPALYSQLMERKTIPEKKDFRFTLLIDLSGSMAGNKIEQTFRGAILLAEALNRVGIQVEILGFQDDLIEFKGFDEQFDDAIRRRMSGMIAEVSNSNPDGHNRSDWNDDGFCVSQAAKRLREQSGKDKFLIVFSDGEPVPSPAHAKEKWDLKKIVGKLKEEKLIKQVGVGLGAGTEHVRGFYPNSIVIDDVTDLPGDLTELFRDMIANPESY